MSAERRDMRFPLALFLLFLGLKLGRFGDVAHWSWWWVFAPIWVTVLLWFAHDLFKGR